MKNISKFLILVLLIASLSFSACGPGQVLGPTLTPTPTITPTSTPTPTPTNTPTQVPTPTETPLPSPIPITDGWSEYSVSNFHISLPDNWNIVDIDKEGIEAAREIVKGFNNDWAQYLYNMVSSEMIADMLKLLAVDSTPAGIGYATVNVMEQTMPFAIKSADLCIQLPATYDQIGIELIDSECGLEINGLDVARFKVQTVSGAFTITQYQYVYVKGENLWTVTTGVDNTVWSDYVSTFETIGDSFWIDQ